MRKFLHLKHFQEGHPTTSLGHLWVYQGALTVILFFTVSPGLWQFSKEQKLSHHLL